MKEMTRIRHRRRAARAACPVCLVACLLLAGPAAFGQSFNIDFDFPSAPPALGGGPPSAAFGAAAGQPGYWNAVWSTSTLWRLRDLQGSPANVWLDTRGLAGRNTGAWNFTGNTGDYAKLLNDGESLDPASSLVITGLQPGSYTVTTYAVVPIEGRSAPVYVSVPGSPPGENPQRVTGPMPGNSFEYLITHSIHHALIESDTLTIDLIPDGVGRGATLNGLQIQQVPEPSSLLIVSSGIAFLLGVRRWGGRAVSGG
ncbi:MAG: PEP-CTERM sorting domain-containing protein [Armatimonadetes bacterium]|nr:PEP-CTERM sorting domain-containing protein [Armatimonadota bacterium]